MANDIITVEDYNSVLMNFKDSFFYIIDTSIIPESQGTATVDFVKISKEQDTNYTIEFENKLWTGGYYLLDANNHIINDFDITFYSATGHNEKWRAEFTSDAPIKIALYMTPIHNREYLSIETKSFEYYAEIGNNVFFLNDSEREYVFDIDYFGTQTITSDFKLILETYNGVEVGITDYEILPNGNRDIRIKFTYSPTEKMKELIKLEIGREYTFYFYQKEFKKKNLVNWEFELACGSNWNESHLEAQYYENIQATVTYNDIKETYEFRQQLLEIPIKLGNILKEEPIDITLELTEGEYTQAEKYIFKVTPIITSYGSFQSLKSVLTNTDGVKILKLNGNIQFTADININHDVIIQGNGFNLDLNGYSLINKGYTVKIYDVNFINGNPAIKQKANSNLEIYDCSFEDCTNEATDGLGTCIQCDTSIEGLSHETDFLTTVQNTDFTNSSGAILHGGELIVNGCKFLINDYTAIRNVPAFLYQTDGECSIRNSVFDIDLDTTYFCEEEIDVKLGQALLVCGKTAIINGKTYEDLKKDNNINFFGNPYNNISHIFIKYYYPQIEDCVFLSPIPNREDRNICYAVSGVDWIFKENVQITRASWQTENRINNIEW